MHRFKKGDFVVIRNVIFTRREGQSGRIIGITPSRWGRSSLDKYVVVFSDGEQEEFWDVQLEWSNPKR